MPWTTVAAGSHSYTTLVASTTSGWAQSGLSIEARSRVSALARIYPLSETTQRDIDFTWRVNSAAPWQVATGTPVRITVSRMTVGV